MDSLHLLGVELTIEIKLKIFIGWRYKNIKKHYESAFKLEDFSRTAAVRSYEYEE